MTHFWGKGRGICIYKDCTKELVESDFVQVTLVPRTVTRTRRGLLHSYTETRDETPWARWFWDAEARWDGPMLTVMSHEDGGRIETFTITGIESFREGKAKYHRDEKLGSEEGS